MIMCSRCKCVRWEQKRVWSFPETRLQFSAVSGRGDEHTKSNTIWWAVSSADEKCDSSRWMCLQREHVFKNCPTRGWAERVSELMKTGLETRPICFDSPPPLATLSFHMSVRASVSPFMSHVQPSASNSIHAHRCPVGLVGLVLCIHPLVALMVDKLR